MKQARLRQEMAGVEPGLPILLDEADFAVQAGGWGRCRENAIFPAAIDENDTWLHEIRANGIGFPFQGNTTSVGLSTFDGAR